MTLLDDLKIGNPAKNALAHAGYKYLEELTKLTEKYILSIHGVGPKAVKILKEELKKHNLSLKLID